MYKFEVNIFPLFLKLKFVFVLQLPTHLRN